MVSRFSNELSVRVWDNDEGVSIEVSPDLEIECIRIKAPDEASKDYYGAIDIAIPKDLIPALLEAVQAVMDAGHWDAS